MIDNITCLQIVSRNRGPATNLCFFPARSTYIQYRTVGGVGIRIGTDRTPAGGEEETAHQLSTKSDFSWTVRGPPRGRPPLLHGRRDFPFSMAGRGREGRRGPRPRAGAPLLHGRRIPPLLAPLLHGQRGSLQARARPRGREGRRGPEPGSAAASSSRRRRAQGAADMRSPIVSVRK